MLLCFCCVHRCPAARRQPCWPRSQTRLSNGPARPFPRRLPLCTRSTSIDAGPLEDAGAIPQVVTTELPHFVCEASRSRNQATQIVIGRAQWSGRSLGYKIVRANNAALQRVYYLRTSVFLRSCRIRSLRLVVPANGNSSSERASARCAATASMPVQRCKETRFTAGRPRWRLAGPSLGQLPKEGSGPLADHRQAKYNKFAKASGSKFRVGAKAVVFLFACLSAVPATRSAFGCEPSVRGTSPCTSEIARQLTVQPCATRGNSTTLHIHHQTSCRGLFKRSTSTRQRSGAGTFPQEHPVAHHHGSTVYWMAKPGRPTSSCQGFVGRNSTSRFRHSPNTGICRDDRLGEVVRHGILQVHGDLHGTSEQDDECVPMAVLGAWAAWAGAVICETVFSSLLARPEYFEPLVL